MYSALIEIGAFGWFDLTVTVSFEFLIGVGFEIDAVQVACGPVPVVVAVAALVVVAVAALVVAPANVVTAVVDDAAVVGVDERVVTVAGDVLGGLRPPPQPANPAANATEPATDQQLRANNEAPQSEVMSISRVALAVQGRDWPSGRRRVASRDGWARLPQLSSE